MLPELNKKKSLQLGIEGPASNYRAKEEEIQNKDDRKNAKSVSAKKVRAGGGFMKSKAIEDRAEAPTQRAIQHQYYQKFAKIRKTEDLSSEIKLIEKKIKACQKKIQQDRRKEKLKIQQATRDQQRADYNFQNVVRRQMELQGFQYNQGNEDQHNFDYLTNPKLKGTEEQEQNLQENIQKPLILQAQPYNIDAGIQKLERFYENSLKRKFERREVFPHQPCRRKTPKLYITQKTNALNKVGKVQNQTEHLFRVLTKQTTPQQIYPTIPNFAVVKDSLSKNIVAYLGDYKPFLQKTKDGLGKSKERLRNQEEFQQQTKYNNKQSRGMSSQALKINAKAKTKTNQHQQLKLTC